MNAKSAYDPVADAMYVTLLEREYDTTIDEGMFILDLDSQKNIVSVEILNAAHTLRVSKTILQQSKISARIIVEEELIVDIILDHGNERKTIRLTQPKPGEVKMGRRVEMAVS